MKCNVGELERVFRIVVGAGLLVTAVGFLEASGVRIVALSAGTVLLVTGLLRFCPLTRLLGINTCRS